MNNKGNTIQKEIEKRLASHVWDQAMAARVMEVRRSRRKWFLYSSGGLSMVTALVLVVLSLFVDQSLQDAGFQGFITQQVEGTYSSVYKDEKLVLTAYENDEQVDDLIADTLSMR